MALDDNNILIFPLIPSHKNNESLKEENIKQEIDELSKHYMKHLALHCKNHGMNLDDTFYKDFNLVFESFKSTLLRSVGKHHKLQDYVDQLEILSENKNSG